MTHSHNVHSTHIKHIIDHLQNTVTTTIMLHWRRRRCTLIQMFHIKRKTWATNPLCWAHHTVSRYSEISLYIYYIFTAWLIYLFVRGIGYTYMVVTNLSTMKLLSKVSRFCECSSRVVCHVSDQFPFASSFVLFFGAFYLHSILANYVYEYLY